MKTILITGGAGLIGKELAKYYSENDYKVYIYDNYSNIYNDYSTIYGENLYSEEESLADIFSFYEFDVISHHAARVGVGQSQYEISDYFHNNVQLTADLLQAMVDTKNFSPRLILASSMGPYGEGEYFCPYCKIFRVWEHQRISFIGSTECPNCHRNMVYTNNTENTKRIPQSMYALTKMTQEEMFRIFAETYDVYATALRYFSVYSSTSNPLNPYTGVLSLIANKILTSDIIELYEDGLQTRDLVHVKDVAKIHFYVSEFWPTQMFDTFNVGTGKSVSMLYVAEKMRDILAPGKKITINGKVRKGDIKNSSANIYKTCLTYSWHPTIDIDTGIEMYCNWIKANKFDGIDTAKIETDNLDNRGLLYG